jgi:hypothetical protein
MIQSVLWAESEVSLGFLKQSFVLFLLGCATAVYSQQAHVLTDQEVQAAIDRGYTTKYHGVGLGLHDDMHGCGTCATDGYSVHLYTSAQWIEVQAFQAKRKLLPFTLADITPEMRQPVLIVDAWPDTPHVVTAQGSSVERVVLADLSKQDVVEALSCEKKQVEMESAFRSTSYTRVIATFSMENLQKIRGSNGDGEFYVIVVGGYNKDFKVKSKMFNKLF